VNTDEDLDYCLDLGVEAVITDRPDHVRRFLEEWV
jgi:glycerophosphoryl diester phosphodiesterase